MVYDVFQVMPPQGGIAGNGKCELTYIAVSSHAPARGHPQTAGFRAIRFQFQVMPPQGGIMLLCHSYLPVDPSFKSCPRKGASKFEDLLLTKLSEFQVMPPQGGI